MRNDIITGRSYPNTMLETFRYVGDPAADAVIAAVAVEGGHAAVGPLMKFLTDYQDFGFNSQSNAVHKFITSQDKFPEFTDRKLFDSGISFFWKHYQVISLLLGTYSLPYCYAGANGAQVLWISERIRHNTFQRLEETGAFVFGVMQERDWHNGINFQRVAKIRLLHAAIRWYTLGGGRWNDDWGYPIC